MARPNGEAIYRYRADKGWSQERLAFEAVLSRPVIGRAEQGRRSTWITVSKIAKALGIGDDVGKILLPTRDGPPIIAQAISETGPFLLPPPPLTVVGRDRDVVQLTQRLLRQEHHPSSDGGNPITIIRGLPGVGKTTLAAFLVHQQELVGSFPDGILWCTLGPTANVLSELAHWGLALGIADAIEASTVAMAKTRLAGFLHSRRVLLVIDDGWRADHVAHFLVGGPHCSMLVTTRLNEVALAVGSSADAIYTLNVLSYADALELFTRLAPAIAAENPRESQELVQKLEGLPLAIHVAGRLLVAEAQNQWGVEDLLRDLRADTETLLKAPAPADMADSLTDAAPTVASLLNRSTDRLSARIRTCFAQLGACAPDPATFSLASLRVLWKTKDPRPIIRALVDRGLLEPMGTSRFRMHALLAAHARTLLRK